MKKEEKSKIIASFARKNGDTGSSEVQVAVLTAKINELTEHLKVHKKDNSTRHGLIAMVNLRRKLLRYLSGKNHERYLSLSDELKLRRK